MIHQLEEEMKKQEFEFQKTLQEKDNEIVRLQLSLDSKEGQEAERKRIDAALITNHMITMITLKPDLQKAKCINT